MKSGATVGAHARSVGVRVVAPVVLRDLMSPPNDHLSPRSEHDDDGWNAGDILRSLLDVPVAIGGPEGGVGSDRSG